MIITRLQGGHSNQLFQYAVARHLALRRRTQLLLDTTWFDDFADVDTPRVYELDCYPLASTTTKLEGISVIDPRQPVRRLDAVLRKSGIGKKVWMFHEKHQGFDPDVLELPDNTMLVGFWQCAKYFADIRSQLLKELQTTTPLTEKNAGYLQQIKRSEAVSIHIRRGDYISNKNAAAFHGLMGLEYYRQALNVIKERAGQSARGDLQLFVFSNDIAWCKENMDFDIPMTFVEGNENGSDDMNLMKQCKHFIMANSSFSWWGAWLAENPGKIVVAPKIWFQDKQANAEIDIIPDEWIRL